MRSTPMKRTAWPRRDAAPTLKKKQPLAPVQCAPVAIKTIVKCTAVMAQKADFVPTPCPKAPKPWRNRAYLMLVASLECYHCRLHGHSQAAHPNTGKTKGVKACDSLVFPMCTVGGRNCHGRFDLYQLVPRHAMPAFEAAAVRWTIATLQERGLWPKTNQPLAPALLDSSAT